MPDRRKSHTIWLKPRHVQMLAQMGMRLPDISRKAIEETFEARNEREFARIMMEDDLAELAAEWERVLGMITSFTITATEDGFRAVLVGLKKFNG